MKNVQKNSSLRCAGKPLEAPIVLTPDQVAMVAAGASSGPGSTTTSGGLQGFKVVADDLVVKTYGKGQRD